MIFLGCVSFKVKNKALVKNLRVMGGHVPSKPITAPILRRRLRPLLERPCCRVFVRQSARKTYIHATILPEACAARSLAGFVPTPLAGGLLL